MKCTVIHNGKITEYEEEPPPQENESVLNIDLAIDGTLCIDGSVTEPQVVRLAMNEASRPLKIAICSLETYMKSQEKGYGTFGLHVPPDLKTNNPVIIRPDDKKNRHGYKSFCGVTSIADGIVQDKTSKAPTTLNMTISAYTDVPEPTGICECGFRIALSKTYLEDWEMNPVGTKISKDCPECDRNIFTAEVVENVKQE